MARLPNTATKEERREVHKAKIAGKRYDQARLVQSFEATGGMTPAMQRELQIEYVKRDRANRRRLLRALVAAGANLQSGDVVSLTTEDPA